MALLFWIIFLVAHPSEWKFKFMPWVIVHDVTVPFHEDISLLKFVEVQRGHMFLQRSRNTPRLEQLVYSYFSGLSLKKLILSCALI